MRISTAVVAAAHAFYADIILQGLAGLFPGHRPHRTFYPRSHLRVVAAFVNLQPDCTTLPYNFRFFFVISSMCRHLGSLPQPMISLPCYDIHLKYGSKSVEFRVLAIV